MAEPLKIAYAGSLNSHFPGKKPGFVFRGLKTWFWTYQPDNIYSHTRSGYFLFKGLQLLKKQYGRSGEDLQVHLWGNIDEGNRQQVDAFGISDMVTISGFCSQKETKQRYSGSDVLFLPLESGKNGQRPLFIPGKLYEYLQTGKPILSLGTPSDCFEIIKKSGLGVLSDNRPEQIAERLDSLIISRDQLTRKYQPDHQFIKQYDFRKITKKLSEIFDEVLFT